MKSVPYTKDAWKAMVRWLLTLINLYHGECTHVRCQCVFGLYDCYLCRGRLRDSLSQCYVMEFSFIPLNVTVGLFTILKCYPISGPSLAVPSPPQSGCGRLKYHFGQMDDIADVGLCMSCDKPTVHGMQLLFPHVCPCSSFADGSGLSWDQMVKQLLWRFSTAWLSDINQGIAQYSAFNHTSFYVPRYALQLILLYLPRRHWYYLCVFWASSRIACVILYLHALRTRILCRRHLGVCPGAFRARRCLLL